MGSARHGLDSGWKGCMRRFSVHWLGHTLGGFAALLALGLGAPPPVAAWGVGMNALAVDEVVEALKDDPAWQEALTPSDAVDVVRFGAAFPTWVRGLPRLHFDMDESRADAVRLARHLLERSEDHDVLVRRLERRLFALGLLVDARTYEARSLLLASSMASSSLGPLHLRDALPTTSEAAMRGDASWVLQGWVDLLVAGPERLVDVLYEGVLGSERVRQRAEGLTLWYCEEASAFFGRSPDCLEAVLDFRRWHQETAALFAGSTQEQARHAARVWAGDDASSLLRGWWTTPLRRLVLKPPDDLALSARMQDRLLTEGWGEADFWSALLEPLFPLVVSWVRDSFDREPQGALVSRARAEAYASQVSMMRFLPEYYAPSPRLVVDHLQWRNAEGERIEELPRARAGEDLFLEIRWLATVALEASVTVRVRLDRPGWDATVDTILHEETREPPSDPATWVQTPVPASLYRVTLPEDLDEVEGLYVEVLLEGEERPVLTTRVDRFWRIGALDLTTPARQLAIRSYGRFPGSLPILDPVVRQSAGELFVRTRGLQGGPPLEEVEVLVAAEGSQQILRRGTSADGGFVAFEGLPPGRYNVVGRSLRPQQVRGEVQVQVDVAAFTRAFVTVALERVPEVEAPGPWQPGPRCARFRWNADAFEGSVDAIRVGVIDGEGAYVIPMQRLDPELVQVCRGLQEPPLPENVPLRVQLATVYDVSASAGLVASSAPFQVDPLAPTFNEVRVNYDDARCADPSDSASVDAWLEAGPSGVVEVGWRSPRETGTLRPLEDARIEETEGEWRVTVPVPSTLRDERPWVLVARSGAGVVGASTRELAFPPADPGRCGPDEPDVGPGEDVRPGDDVVGDPDGGSDVSDDEVRPPADVGPDGGSASSRASGGCSAAHGGSPAPGALGFGLILWGVRRDRRTRRGRHDVRADVP